MLVASEDKLEWPPIPFNRHYKYNIEKSEWEGYKRRIIDCQKI